MKIYNCYREIGSRSNLRSSSYGPAIAPDDATSQRNDRKNDMRPLLLLASVGARATALVARQQAAFVVQTSFFQQAMSSRSLASPLVMQPISGRGSAARMMCGTPDQITVVGTVRETPSGCRDKIQAALEPSQLEVKGAFDDPNGSHIAIFCVSEKFEGKRSLARQQMVFKAIWDEMQGACL
eukprot:6187696-Pleurochrysis_carterae.AAC.1